MQEMPRSSEEEPTKVEWIRPKKASRRIASVTGRWMSGACICSVNEEGTYNEEGAYEARME